MKEKTLEELRDDLAEKATILAMSDSSWGRCFGRMMLTDINRSYGDFCQKEAEAGTHPSDVLISTIYQAATMAGWVISQQQKPGSREELIHTSKEMFAIFLNALCDKWEANNGKG